MRKKVLGLFMAAIAVSTIGAFAQNDNQQTREQIKKECCKEKKECTKDKKCKKDHKMREGKKEKLNPFAGIELTAEQQKQLEQLKADRKAKREAAKETKKQAFEQERKAFDAEIAKILSPDQYKQYESTKANMRAHKKDKAKRNPEKQAR